MAGAMSANIIEHHRFWYVLQPTSMENKSQYDDVADDDGTHQWYEGAATIFVQLSNIFTTKLEVYVFEAQNKHSKQDTRPKKNECGCEVDNS